MSDTTVYKKVGRKYVPIAPEIWNGFPMDGIWIVKFNYGYEKSASCVSRLDNLPEPYPFYNMMMSRDEIALELVKIFDGNPISLQQAADRLIKFLAELNKPERLRIKFPKKPNSETLTIPNKNNINDFL
jgi:hypothetical protein